MTNLNSDSLHDAILNEKRCLARNLLHEAWEVGVEAGIEPDLLADALMQSLIEKFAKQNGPEGVMALTERFRKFVEEGRFLDNGSFH